MRDHKNLKTPKHSHRPQSTALHLVSVDEASLLLRRSVRTIRYWQANGKMPERFRVGRRLMYIKDQLALPGGES
ncbi:helix-turn-helix domain-containing protein [Pelagibacterium mangrovi]|uniref:helix-turn-helix domain-containing protein n=1 Tax=Pelagibacterium mangrovi TaxID=3119828 RepID=UPI002FC81513